MKILITGGLGFIGSNLARHLIEHGHDVRLADNLVRRGSERNLAEFERAFHHCDFRSEEDVALLPPVELVVSCHSEMVVTGAKGYEHPELPIRNNGVSMLNVLAYCRRNGSRLLHISTNRVYNLDPLFHLPVRELPTRLALDGFHGISRETFSTDGGEKGIYGISKLIADQLAQEYHHAFGVPCTIDRIGSITGPGQFGCVEQGWASHFVLSYWKREPIAFIGYGGKQVRDLLHVRDLCSLIALQVERSAFDGEVQDIGGGETRALSLIEAKSMLDDLFGYAVPITNMPQKKADPPVTYMDNSRVTARYGWTPQVSLDEMFREMRDAARPLVAAAEPCQSR